MWVVYVSLFTCGCICKHVHMRVNACSCFYVKDTFTRVYVCLCTEWMCLCPCVWAYSCGSLCVSMLSACVRECVNESVCVSEYLGMQVKFWVCDIVSVSEHVHCVNMWICLCVCDLFCMQVINVISDHVYMLTFITLIYVGVWVYINTFMCLSGCVSMFVCD